MGEHNLLNPGFVGQFVNIHTRDACYLSNVRASGGPLAGLGHTLRFSRRDNVCSLPWNSSEPCTGYPQSYVSGPVSINSTYNQSCDIPLQEDNKCFYSESACATSGGGDNNSTNLKSNEKARENSSLSTSSENGLKNVNGMDNRGSLSKYDYLTIAEYLTPNPGLTPDSGSSILNEGAKTTSDTTHSLTSPDIHASVAALNGGESL